MDALLPPLDALLPPLDAFAVVELTAPPELNENSDLHADSSNEMDTNIVEDTFLPTLLTDAEDAAGHEGSKSPKSDSIDSHFDESANDGSTVKGELQLKQLSLDDFFKARKDDSDTENVDKRKFAGLIASPWLADDTEIAVRDSLNGLLDAVISEVEGQPDACGDHRNDSDEDDEQVATTILSYMETN